MAVADGPTSHDPGDAGVILAGAEPTGRAVSDDGLHSLPGRVVRWYAVVAAAWIVLSDLWVAEANETAVAERLPDLVKGLGFVAVTTALLWFVLRRLTAGHQRAFRTTVTAQRDFYQSVLATSSDAVAILDERGCVAYINHAATEILGWTAEEVVGRPGRELVHPDDWPAVTGFLENLVADQRPTRSLRTFALRRVDGSYRSMEIAGAPVALADGRRGVVLNARDITERVRSEQQLRAALAEDVTGLPNLRAFTAELALLDQIRSAGVAVTAVLVDIDRFGDVNALHGRDAGDAVLREIAQRLEAALPQAVGVWHHGVDEFLAVLFDERSAGAGDDAASPESLVERIRHETSPPIVLDGTSPRVSVSVSVGVSQVLVDGRRGAEPLSETLLRGAEAALSDAKRHPDRVAFHLGRGDDAGDRARLVAELNDAIENDELVVRYQPKVRLEDGEVVGVEALVRWQHPRRGLLEPAEFLPAVAAANLAGPLTDVVLRRSLDQASRWLALGCNPAFTVSVNISLDDLRRANFVTDVFAALERCSVHPGRLTLEITEQTMLADPAGAKETIASLRAAGVAIAIDDFGTGFSALEHIRLFEVDELKIDKTFIQNVGRRAADEAIVDSILAMGSRLGVVVTAEGIEEASVLDHLRHGGCQLGQGYLFGRPMAAERFDPLIVQRDG